MSFKGAFQKEYVRHKVIEKAILHTPRMMYGGRGDMCPHLHTITPYYLISFFHFPYYLKRIRSMLAQ